MLHREAGPKADSLLRRKFVATTVSKARQFLDASELTRTVKKPAIRATSPSVNYQSNLDGLMEALDQRMAEVNTAQASNSNNRGKKTAPRQGSPAPSNASTGSSASRASSTGRTVRFQDQEDARSGNQAYGSSVRSRWQGSQPAQGNGNGSWPRSDRRQPGQAPPRPQPSGSNWIQRQGGPPFPPPQPGGSRTQGQGGPRLCPPAPGNTSNWRPGWTGPWRIELFKSPLVVVLKHTEKRTRQTVHIDRLLPCHTPPPAVPEADSGVPTDIPTETDELDTPDADSQPLMGMEEDSQSWGDTESQTQSASGSLRPVRKRRRPMAWSRIS